jgi:hypothetical protein
MAAFCVCCGAEITQKAEACPVCRTPRHGMLPPGPQHPRGPGKNPFEENPKGASRLHDS